MSTDQFQIGNRKKSHGPDTLELGGLSEHSRKTLHRMLYRQECRVWLLALGLPLGVMLIMAEAAGPFSGFVKWAAIVVGVLLSFWVGAPSQKVLARLREDAAPGEQSQIERRFDNSWRSLWDFAPPLVPPVVIYLILLLYKIWWAMEQ